MFKDLTLIYGRKDLLERFKNLNINQVEASHLSASSDNVQKYSLVLFVDDDKNMKVIKNRFGSKATLV